MYPAANRTRGYTYEFSQYPVPPVRMWPQSLHPAHRGFWDLEVAHSIERPDSTAPTPPTPIDRRFDFDALASPDELPEVQQPIRRGCDAKPRFSTFGRRATFLAPHRDATAAADSEAEEVYTYKSRARTAEDVLEMERDLVRMWPEVPKKASSQTLPTRRGSMSSLMRSQHPGKLRATKSMKNLRKPSRRQTMPVMEVFAEQHAYADDNPKGFEALPEQQHQVDATFYASPVEVPEEASGESEGDFFELTDFYYVESSIPNDGTVRPDSPILGPDTMSDGSSEGVVSESENVSELSYMTVTHVYGSDPMYNMPSLSDSVTTWDAPTLSSRGSSPDGQPVISQRDKARLQLLEQLVTPTEQCGRAVSQY